MIELNPETFNRDSINKDFYLLISEENFDLLVQRFTGAKILFIRSEGIGDILMCIPTIRAIREKFKPYLIDFACKKEFIPLLEDNPYIDNVISVEDVNRSSYSLVLDLEKKLENFKLPYNKLHRVDGIAAYCGVHPQNRTSFYSVREEEKIGARTFIGEQRNIKKIGVAPFAFGLCRNWDVSYAKRLYAMIEQNGQYPLIFSKVEMPEKNTSTLNLRETIACLNEMDLLISCDTGFVHIAGMLGVPTIALFGSIPSDLRIRYYPECYALVGNVPCVPCYDWQTVDSEKKNRCIRECKSGGISFCMKSITPEQVFVEITKFFGKEKP